MADIEAKLDGIIDHIAAAAAKAGRRPEEVEIMAVTKTLPREAVSEAYAAGIRLFGENRVQEAAEKYDQILEDTRLHLIGHLQRNKAKQAAELFSCVESIDKTSTAAALSKARAGAGDRSLDILLEYNTSGEDSKFGFTDSEALRRCIDEVLALPGLRIRGLMTIGPFTTDGDRIHAAFAHLRELFEGLRHIIADPEFDTLSMGMSSDYAIAVEEGATRVRIGTALFGARHPA